LILRFGLIKLLDRDFDTKNYLKMGTTHLCYRSGEGRIFFAYLP